jgi:hypothetical protein
MKMQITFRSGAQITVDVTEFSTARTPITDKLARLSWKTPENATSWLHGIYDLDDVAAIVAIEDPASSAAGGSGDPEPAAQQSA